eukprot:Sspe_Gene.71701::Locus_42594_Transcript_1_1_Confidence_1.000_Length_447::g.71701::m.71701
MEGGKKDVRCLECKQVFRGVFPNRPSGRCSCNGYTKPVSWEWCNANEVEEDTAGKGRTAPGKVVFGATGRLGLSLDDTDKAHKEVQCPMCNRPVSVDTSSITESGPYCFDCPTCRSSLTVDPYRDARVARHM